MLAGRDSLAVRLWPSSDRTLHRCVTAHLHLSSTETALGAEMRYTATQVLIMVERARRARAGTHHPRERLCGRGAPRIRPVLVTKRLPLLPHSVPFCTPPT